MDKLVSVIIPTHGGGKYIKRCIDSVLNQTYKNIEIIVVDDNGLNTENQIITYNNIKSYIDEGKIKYICHDKNINGSAARNTGAKNSSGEYIALLDDDDEYYPYHIETEVNILNSLSDDYALVYCSNDRYVDDVKLDEIHVSYSGYQLYRCLMHIVTPSTCAILVRTSVWEEMGGFDESFKRFQDFEFTVRICAKYKIYASDHIGFRFNSVGRHSAADPDKYKEYKMHYLNKMQPYIELLPKEQQKEVITGDRTDIAFQYLKNKRPFKFIKECFEGKIGFMGFKQIIRRIWKKLSSG